MAESLLAHLYTYIKGSQEDIATLSLQYLLSQSQELNKAFTKRLSDNMEIALDATLQYACQATGKSEEQERPDMSGITYDGREIILCEMKFYATLTQNQPLAYLDRLKDSDGKGLMFICPAIRRTSLWAKLKELCNKRTILSVNEYCIKVDGVNLAIMTWTEVISLLKQVASSVDIQYMSDIQQLEGYCNRLDSDAFIPFLPEDLSAETAKKVERYYQVIDEVIELLHADSSIKTSKKGLKATAYRKGYTRSMYIDDFSISLNYERDLWKNPSSVETPFWVAVRDKDWQQTQEICDKITTIPEQKKGIHWGMTFLALEPLTNATFSEVCENIKQQLLDYINMCR